MIGGPLAGIGATMLTTRGHGRVPRPRDDTNQERVHVRAHEDSSAAESKYMYNEEDFTRMIKRREVVSWEAAAHNRGTLTDESRPMRVSP